MCDRCIEWNGKRWHVYGDGRGAYYQRTDKRVKPNKTRRLHRAVYEHHHGEIPKGFDVHHGDGNKLNNDIENLECIEHGEHKSLHVVADPIPQCDWSAKPEVKQPCTWCGVVVKRRRASSLGNKPVSCKSCQYRRADEKRKTLKSCQNCGVEFRSRSGNFCGQRCVNVATAGATVSVLPESRRRA